MKNSTINMSEDIRVRINSSQFANCEWTFKICDWTLSQTAKNCEWSKTIKIFLKNAYFYIDHVLL